MTPRRRKLGSIHLDEVMENIREEGDCWIWTGSLNRDRFAVYTFKADPNAETNHKLVSLSAPRLMYQFYCEDIPPHRNLLSSCANKYCVHPLHHTFDKTKRAKTAHKRGAGHHKAKLTENDVKNILARARRGERIIEIAKHYPVSELSVRLVVQRKTWAHVT